MVTRLEDLFPGLRAGNYQITSPSQRRYNCIAWAAGDDTRWWWPEEDIENGYWVPGVDAEVTMVSFLDAFATLGYVACDREDQQPGFERIAIFADAAGNPTHAARQLSNGRWTSKLGTLEDIEHDLEDLVGQEYGTVAQIMRRPVSSLS